MPSRLGLLTIDDLRGGRNGVDPPFTLPEDQCVEAINVDFYDGLLGRRRKGASILNVSGSNLTASVASLLRYTPTTLQSDAILFAVDTALNAARFLSGIWVPTNLIDTPAANFGTQVYGVSFNTKLFLAYKSTVDRLHVYDPGPGTIRRTGASAPPAAPILAAAGGAGITATRFYRLTWTVLSGTTIIRRSEPGPAASLAITNQGGWGITHPAAPPDVTHWEVWAATTAAGPFYRLAFSTNDQIPVGTPGAADPNAVIPLSWPVAPASGSYTDLPSAKYLSVDEARLLLGSSWMVPAYESRVWWTPILNDASTVGNDEHLNGLLSPFIDLDPGNGGGLTGFGGPMYDCTYAFKYDQIYKLIRTGLSLAPYRPVTVSKRCGAISGKSIVLAEDESGNDTLYFLSRRGPYRLGVNGLQYCGRDIEDVWATINLPVAGGTDAPAHGVWYPDLHQIWWWIPTGTNTFPDTKIVFDVRLGTFVATQGVRKGWVLHKGASAQALSSSIFASTADGLLRPYIGQQRSDAGVYTVPPVGTAPPTYTAVQEPRVWVCDTGNFDGAAVGYEAAIVSRAIAIGGSISKHGGLLEGHVIGRAEQQDGFVLLSTIRDFGVERRDATIIRFPVRTIGGVVRYILELRDLAVVSSACVQLRIGDDVSQISSGTIGQWILDHLALRVRGEEDR